MLSLFRWCCCCSSQYIQSFSFTIVWDIVEHVYDDNVDRFTKVSIDKRHKKVHLVCWFRFHLSMFLLSATIKMSILYTAKCVRCLKRLIMKMGMGDNSFWAGKIDFDHHHRHQTALKPNFKLKGHSIRIGPNNNNKQKKFT